MKLSKAYLQCQDKSGRLGSVAGSVVLYVIYSIIANVKYYRVGYTTELATFVLVYLIYLYISISQ
jgi:hypothetical protein